MAWLFSLLNEKKGFGIVSVLRSLHLCIASTQFIFPPDGTTRIPLKLRVITY